VKSRQLCNIRSVARVSVAKRCSIQKAGVLCEGRILETGLGSCECLCSIECVLLSLRSRKGGRDTRVQQRAKHLMQSILIGIQLWTCTDHRSFIKSKYAVHGMAARSQTLLRTAILHSQEPTTSSRRYVTLPARSYNLMLLKMAHLALIQLLD
jgi:hypothetical protein